MKKIGNQHHVVIRSQFHVERAPGNRAEAVGDARGMCLLPRVFQHRRPVKGDEVGLWVFPGESNAPGSMTRRNIENFGGIFGIQRHQPCQPFGCGKHETTHGTGKCQPHRMFWRGAALLCFRRAAVADRLREMFESLGEMVGQQKFHCSAEIGGGFAIEKNRAIRCQVIFVARLFQETEHGHVIAQDANTAHSGVTAGRNVDSRQRSLGQNSEEIQVNRRLESRRFLISGERVKK